MDSQSIDALESTLRQLQDAVKGLGNSSDIDELLVVIHNQGWTTPREHFFVTSIAEALTQQLQTASSLKEILIAGSRSIDAGDDGPIIEAMARKKKADQPPPDLSPLQAAADPLLVRVPAARAATQATTEVEAAAAFSMMTSPASP